MYLIRYVSIVFFFFFKQKTAYEIVDCDWSSDVCSSDLRIMEVPKARRKNSSGKSTANLAPISPPKTNPRQMKLAARTSI